MKQTHDSIATEWLTRPTGDPFADVGGYVIRHLSALYPEQDILGLIEHVAKIYVNRWDAKIHSFYLNSTITHASIPHAEKVPKTIEYFRSLLEETAPFEVGFCRISGRKTKLYRSGRENTLMSGSGKFVNFHANFQEGMMLSKEMLIRMFFIPYGSILVGGQIAVIHGNNENINVFFVEQNCKENDANIGMSTAGNVLKSEYGMPANALFRFVDDLLHSYSGIEKGDIKPSLALYHFTNFGASPNIVIYELPTTVFSFYSACQSALKVDWQPFLMSHYTNSKHKGAHYNPATSAYEIVKKNETERIEFESYKTWRNRVLEDLLNGNSLLGKFKRWGISHRFNFEIVEIYQKYIQNMKQETLEKIKELALFLTDTDEDAIKKHIRALDGSKSAYELRRFFLKKVVVKNYNNGAEKPKITLDEWVNYLFSDDIAWRDVRDVLLVAIYQKLHEKNIRVEVPEAEALEDDNIEDQQ